MNDKEKQLGIDFIGCEIVLNYLKEAEERIEGTLV